MAYRTREIMQYPPWCNIDETALSTCRLLSNECSALMLAHFTHFADLICSMLEPNPHQRISLAQLKQHPWYNRANAYLDASVSVAEKTGNLVQAFMEGMVKAGDLPLHTDGERAEVIEA
jgi:serine/threonine protein kinase